MKTLSYENKNFLFNYYKYIYLYLNRKMVKEMQKHSV